MKRFNLLSVLILVTSQVLAGSVAVNRDQMFLSANAPRNYVRNSGAEKNDAGVTDASSIHSRTTTTPLFGAGSHLIDASAGSQNVDFLADNFEAGLLGQNCEAQFSVSGDATLYTAIVRVNSADVTTAMSLPNVTNSQPVSILFPCGTSGVSPVLRISSTSASAAAIEIDEVYIGKAISLGNVGQAEVLLRGRRTSSDQSILSTAATVLIYNNVLVDPYSGLNTSTGVYTIPKNGRIQVQARAFFGGYNAAELHVLAVRKNGTTTCRLSVVATASSEVNSFMPTCITDVVVGDTIDITSQSVADAGYLFDGDSDTARTSFDITLFPNSSTQSYSLMNTYWKVDAIISGANPALSTTDVSSYTGITNGSLTLTNNAGTGNINAQIGCATTTPPEGTTCNTAAVDESVAIAFTPQGTFPQDVLACASFGHNSTTSTTANDAVEINFQLVETATNAQTIIQEGKSRFGAQNRTPSAAAMNLQFPFRVCGNFTFTTPGQKMLRLMYEQDVIGTPSANAILADANGAAGQRNVHWEVYPLSFQTPVPILVGGVTSGSAGAERIERARINLSGASACSIVSQSGSWVSSVSASGGNCTVNFTAGTFSSSPNCVCNVSPSVTNSWCRGANSMPSTSSGIFTSRDTTNTLVTQEFDLICMGPR